MHSCLYLLVLNQCIETFNQKFTSSTFLKMNVVPAKHILAGILGIVWGKNNFKYDNTVNICTLISNVRSNEEKIIFAIYT